MEAGFTGTQHGMTREQKVALEDLLVLRAVTRLHHGDCVGADEEAHKIARDLFVRPIVHPPLNTTKRAFCDAPASDIRPPKEYIERNHDIVDDTAELFAASHAVCEELRSGTWATIRYARKQGKRVYIIWPSGLVELRESS